MAALKILIGEHASRARVIVITKPGTMGSNRRARKANDPGGALPRILDMSRIAVIGTGISGLSAAWLLCKHHEVTVYEKEKRPGGHSRTVTVRHGDRIIPVDTGFIVYNERNYPNLSALFARLGVETRPSGMSFALTVDDGWLEWGASDFNAVFGQRRNLLRPRFYRLFADVMRFNARARTAVRDDPDLPLGALIERIGVGSWFARYYLLPMAGAIWSCPPRQMLDFPALSFVRFFENHGLLSIDGQPQWRTVEGGARRYVEKIARDLGGRLRLDCGAAEIRRSPRGAAVRDVTGNVEDYDGVVLACHADEALAVLGDASQAERRALGAIGYRRNRAFLHKDPRFMPRRRRCWASWVYHSDGRGDEPALTVTYWMNRLQSIDPSCPLFVTLNPSARIRDDDIFDEHVFDHPVFDAAAMAGQHAIASLQGLRSTWFCGAHLGYGFHEDGLVSAMNVAAALGAPAPWLQPSQGAIRVAPAAVVPVRLPPLRPRPVGPLAVTD
jgi:predicted NAD/FAD-binding protein